MRTQKTPKMNEVNRSNLIAIHFFVRNTKVNVTESWFTKHEF